MTNEIKELRNEAERARLFYWLGKLSREAAAERIAPYAVAYNVKSKELAKKYKQRPGRFSLAAYLRSM